MSSEINAWFYFFSANAQVFGGLIAISAVFMVYALQWIQSSIEWSRKDLVNLYRPVGIELADQPLGAQLETAKAEVPNLRKRNKAKSIIDEIERVIGIIDGQMARRKIQTAQFIKLLVSKGVVLLVSLALLPWGPQIIGRTSLGVLIIGTVLTGSVIVLICMGIFIYNVLDRDSKYTG